MIKPHRHVDHKTPRHPKKIASTSTLGVITFTLLFLTHLTSASADGISETRTISSSDTADSSSDTTDSSSDTTEQAKVIDLSVDELPSRQRITLGKIPSNQSMEVRFRLKNRQQAAIQLQSIRADCGCLRTVIDNKTANQHQTAQWTALLAPSTRAGQIARKLWIDFDSSQDDSLELTLEAEITAPISLHPSVLHVSGDSEILYIRGKQENGIKIQQCFALRDTLRIQGIKNEDDSFQIETRPLLSFGRTSDLLRFQYTRAGKPEHVDLPIQIHHSRAARFLPSSLPITLNDGQSTVRTRVLLVPGTDLNPNEIRLSLDEDHPDNRGFTIADKTWHQTSKVFIEYEMRIERSPSLEQCSKEPEKDGTGQIEKTPLQNINAGTLKVVATDQNGVNLATLWLSIPESQPKNPPNSYLLPH